MAIDDPIGQARQQVEHAARHRSPVTDLFWRFASSVLDPTNIVECVAEAVTENSKESVAYLVEILIQDLRHHAARIDAIERTFPGQMEGLILDAVRKSAQARSKEKVERIAAILCNAVKVEPTPSADETEELMRVATVLGDPDVVVLRAIVEIQRSRVEAETHRVRHLEAIHSWSDVRSRLRRPQFSDGEILSICSKLESFGLVSREEKRNMNDMGNEPPAFGLLKKGCNFVDFALAGHGATGAEANATGR